MRRRQLLGWVADEDKNIRVFQIFSTGNYRTKFGVDLEFSRLTINTTAGTYDPIRFCAPLCIGHPINDLPPYGEVTKVFTKGDAMYCMAEVSNDLISLVRAGHYKKVSASFFGPLTPGNPVPGAFYLKHVGFLGAVPPAVKGMEPLAFSDTGCLSVGMPIEIASFCESPARRRLDRRTVYDDARLISERLPNISFTEALSLISR